MSRKVLSYREWWGVKDAEDTEFRHIPFEVKTKMYDSYVKREAETSASQAYGNDCRLGGGCE